MEHRVSAHLSDSLLVWGDVTVNGSDKLVADQTCSLDITVNLKKPLPAGARLEGWTHFVSDIQRAQCDTPDAPGYFSADSSDCTIEAFSLPGAKVHGEGTFFPYRRYIGVELPQGAEGGDRVDFQVDNVRMQTYEETLFNVRFAILQGDDELVGYLGDAFYTVIGGEAEFLRVVAPTCVAVGESFDCKVVVCDARRNKCGDAGENLQLRVSAQEPDGDFTSGKAVFDTEWRQHRIADCRIDSEGVFYLSAVADGREDLEGVSNPVVAREAWENKIYWGDWHQHAYFADGRGRPAANYEYAISTSCLDFCCVCPHQEFTFTPGLSHLKVEEAPVQKGWEELIEAAEQYNGDELVTVLGSEAGSLGPLAGHMNSYYLDHSNRPELQRIAAKSGSPHSRPELSSYEEYLEELEDSQGEFLLLPHAHACGGPGKFDLPARPEYQTNVEIVSVHGVFEEFYHQWLKHGHLVGVHGGGDNHMTSTGSANPGHHYPNTNGLTGAYAQTLTRKGIWDAYKDRSTYSVTGNQRIFLQLEVGGKKMGEILPPTDGTKQVNVEIAGTAPLLKVELLKNNAICRTYRPSPDGRSYRFCWTDSVRSRRTDDSQTSGSISAPGSLLSVVNAIHQYNHTDAVTQIEGDIIYRSNGYSGINRGVVLEADKPVDEFVFTVQDVHLGQTCLSEILQIDASKLPAKLERKLDLETRAERACFHKEPSPHMFFLQVDAVDPNGPRRARLDWEIGGEKGDFFYIRAEQIDGNIVWSSPIWIGNPQDLE
ncbi:MAG: hypothetical protein KGZ25_14850 [Planctomycetes bacterium]|nr:hypothetical protein [Planctomycetota bacterium]